MLKKAFLFVLFLFSIFSANQAIAQSSNTGFIPSNIWYSSDPFYEGDKIKIYTLVFNSDERQMSGTVSFFDKNILLGKKDFTVAGYGVRDISIDWSVTAGSHVIFAKIETAKFLISTGKYENAYLDRNETEESRRTVSKRGTITKDPLDKESVPTTDKRIQNLVLENTPDFIAKPIIKVATALENWRSDLAKSDSKTHYLFQYKLVFYGILALLFLGIIRFIWRRVF